MRYIDADKLKSDMKEIAKITGGNLTEFEVLGILSGQPTADVRENVRGEWRKEYLVEDLGIMLYVCDKCAEPTVKKTNFCPNCGADMRHQS